MKRIICTLFTTIALLCTDSAIADASAAKQHCVITVGDVDINGYYVIESTICYSTYQQAQSSVSIQSFTLGVHYDGTNGTGSSTSVVGDDCNGGGLNVSAAWNDRISSTRNGCGKIVHYEHINYGGATYSTTGAGALINIGGSMNNKTSSIKYSS